MTTDALFTARAALASGQPEAAVDLAWKAVRPAVLAQDAAILSSAAHLADEIALASEGRTRIEAEQLSAYCTACILEPRESYPSGWSMKGLFRRGPQQRKTCPDCAEQIASEARVCRFCGYRFGPPANP